MSVRRKSEHRDKVLRSVISQKHFGTES